MKDKAHCVPLSPLGTCRKWIASTLSWLIISFIIIFSMFSVSVCLFVSLSLCLCTEVFVNFHLCKNIIILGVRCLVIQLHLNSLETSHFKNTAVCVFFQLWIGVKLYLWPLHSTHLSSMVMITQIVHNASVTWWW